MQKKCPFSDDFLMIAKLIYVSNRIAGNWSIIEYFLQWYPVLSSIPQDELYDEYFDYQTLKDNEIGTQAWKKPKLPPVKRMLSPLYFITVLMCCGGILETRNCQKQIYHDFAIS